MPGDSGNQEGPLHRGRDPLQEGPRNQRVLAERGVDPASPAPGPAETPSSPNPLPGLSDEDAGVVQRVRERTLNRLGLPRASTDSTAGEEPNGGRGKNGQRGTIINDGE